MQRTQIYMTEDDLKKLKHRAIDLNMSLSELLRHIVKTYLENSDHVLFTEHQRNIE